MRFNTNSSFLVHLHLIYSEHNYLLFPKAFEYMKKDSHLIKTDHLFHFC